MDRLPRNLREDADYLPHADLFEEAACPHPVLEERGAVHQGIRRLSVYPDVHGYLIVDGVVFEDLQGVGNDLLMGRQGFRHVGVDIQAFEAEDCKADDQDGNEKQKREMYFFGLGYHR